MKSLKSFEIKGRYTCEKHYQKDDSEFTPTGKKTVKLGALPILNQPLKSHETPQTSRKPPKERNLNLEPRDTPCYKKISELSKAVLKSKLDDWTVEEKEDETGKSVLLRQRKTPHLLQVYEILFDISMGFSLYVFGWPIPDEHEIYKNLRRSMFNMRITIRNHISQYFVCEGVGSYLENCQENFVQYENELLNEDRGFKGRKYYRPDNCLLSNDTICENCTFIMMKCSKKEKKAIELQHKPLHPNTPLSTVAPGRLIATKDERQKNSNCVSLLSAQLLLLTLIWMPILVTFLKTTMVPVHHSLKCSGKNKRDISRRVLLGVGTIQC